VLSARFSFLSGEANPFCRPSSFLVEGIFLDRGRNLMTFAGVFWCCSHSMPLWFLSDGFLATSRQMTLWCLYFCSVFFYEFRWDLVSVAQNYGSFVNLGRVERGETVENFRAPRLLPPFCASRLTLGLQLNSVLRGNSASRVSQPPEESGALCFLFLLRFPSSLTFIASFAGLLSGIKLRKESFVSRQGRP